MTDYELARALFPKPSEIVDAATAGTPKTSQVRGWATSDSSDGTVTVVLDTDAAGDDAEMEVPTQGGITDGAEVLVTLLDGVPVDVTQVGSIDAAGAATQYFWHDSDGAHVSTTENDATTGPNVLIDSDGMDVRDGTATLATFGANDTHLGLGDGISSVFLANDKFRMRGVTQGRTPQGGSGTIYETYGNILAETVWDGPSQDEHWDPSTGRSYVSRAAIDTYALVPGNEANLTLSAKAMDWLGRSPETRPSQPGEYGPDDFDPYISPDTMYEANIEIHSETANAANSSYIYMTSARVGCCADEITYTMANGDNAWSTPAGTVLWSASSGWQMAANVTATLSYNVSTCPSGIVLHWQAYANSATQDYDHVYTFIPKQHVVASPGKGVVCQLANGGFGYVGTKYVYVHDGKVMGHSSNTATGTASGITYNNGHWVLTQVISA